MYKTLMYVGLSY